MEKIQQWNLVSFLSERLGAENTVYAGLILLGGILLCMIVPYLLGSLNFGLIISKKQYNDDIRRYGSGNAGTTNMLRTYGKRAALFTLLGDMAKAAVSVAFGHFVYSTVIVDTSTGERLFIVNLSGAAIAGLFVMLGHMFPVFYKFKGGKGVATSAMVIFMLDMLNPLNGYIPIVFLICLFIFVVIVVGTRYVSLGSVMGMCLYPVIFTAFAQGQNFTACGVSVVMAVLVVFMHRENIKRLAAGKESKISFKKKKPAEGEEAPAEDTTPAITKGNIPNPPRGGDRTNTSKKKKRK